MTLTIRLLGPPTIERDDDVAVQPVRGHLPWALLARILLASRPLSRQEVASELFSETVDPLGSVRWCLASLRRAIGPQTFGGDPIQPNLPSGTQVDVWRIETGDGDITLARDLLEGISIRGSEPFATWLLIERERLAGRVEERLRQETMVAIAAGDYARAVTLAECSVRRQPLDESGHILLARALTLDGRSDAALAHVEATERVFLAELGERPSPALRSAARRSVSSPPIGVAPRAVVESLIKAGVAALSAGAAEAGLDCLRRAVADAQTARDRELTARALAELGTGLVHSVRGYDDEGGILLRQAVALARECGDQAVASRCLCELGYVEALAGRRPAAARVLDEAHACAAGDHRRLGAIHSFMGFNLSDWGRIEESLMHYELSLDHARTAGKRRREVWSLGLGGRAYLAAGQPETARAWLQTCVAACDEIGWLAFRPLPLALLSEARLKLGDDPMILRSGLEDAFALSCQLSDPCWEAAAARTIALTYAATGSAVLAMQWLVKARSHCVRVTDAFAGLLTDILADQVRLNVKLKDWETARTIARDLISVAARTHADAHLREALALIGDAPQGNLLPTRQRSNDTRISVAGW